MLKAGFYETDITPAIGMERPATYYKIYIKTINDPLKVHAVVISNGEHILTFSASDGASESSVSVRFTKEVRDAVVMLDTPLTASEKITLCVISVNGYIPEDAEMKVEVTNNGNDASPVWEDATQQALTGMNHAFTNAAQTNGWAFNFRVTLHGGDTRGYITSIQGGFQ